MPEYLAPAVYVEETSFRSKPLEGVSTSTTAFVGLTSTGPIGDPEPELITSVGDYERVFGGTASLDIQVDGSPLLNYMAHAVRAYFDNGGRRLYIARTFEGQIGNDGRSSSAAVIADVFFRARNPGSAGNGQLEVREEDVPAAQISLNRAPAGTMVRTGATDPAMSAVVTGNVAGPFALSDGMSLTLSGAASGVIEFTGTAAQMSGSDLGDMSGFDAALPRVLTVIVDGGAEQEISFSTSPGSPGALAMAMDGLLNGVTVTESGGGLVLTSDVAGSTSSVEIAAGDAAAFGLSLGSVTVAGSSVANLAAVTAAEVNNLLALASIAATAFSTATSLLQLTTDEAGPSVTLNVTDSGTPGAAAALGLPLDTATGSGTVSVAFLKNQAGNWFASDGTTPLDIPTELGTGIAFVSLNIVATDKEGQSQNFEGLAYAPGHLNFIGSVLSETPASRSAQLENRFYLDLDAADTSPGSWPFDLRTALIAQDTISLSAGNDGVEPIGQSFSDALDTLEGLEGVSITAAPGSSKLSEAEAIRAEMITDAERRRSYRITVLDTPDELLVGGARAYRADIDSRYAALYYPWVRIANPDLRPGDPSTPREILVPPSGFVCGIYARNDSERGVHKAPANEVVRGALGLETLVNFGQQEVLNPAGVNALRFFPGRGFRVWGARLAASDPEWKYVNLRRYFNYVEASIDRGTQYVVFEPNGPRLWTDLRNSVSDFLFAEWRSGALLGTSAAEAFFVRCDRSTMTQADLDNGRLICEIGIAVVKPAEFVIFRIGQKTAQARS